MHLHPDTARDYIATIDRARADYPGLVDCVGPTLALAENAIRQVADLKVIYKVVFNPGNGGSVSYAHMAEWQEKILPTINYDFDLEGAQAIARLAAEYGIKATIYSRIETNWETVPPTEKKVR